MKKFLYISVLIFCSFNLFASHYMGGEITWECLPNGNYRFIMKVYRECNGIPFSNTVDLNSNVPGFATISMALDPSAILGKMDLSPDCNSNPAFPHINCAPQPSLPNTGAVEEYTYTTDVSYPNGVDLPNFVIPVIGWTFSYMDCCRNPSTNYSASNNQYWYLRAVMYSYPTLSPDNCWDNSPMFEEKPLNVNCIGYPFTYNPVGYDKEHDSLVYEWTQPLSDPGIPLTGINPTFSYNSPLPGPGLNPNNVAAVVNPITGEVSFTSFTTGAFITAYKVTAYKCGFKIAEVFREMQITLLACPEPSNAPPVIQPPFQNTVSGLYSDFVDTVLVGSVVDFNFYCTDTNLLNDSINLQNVSYTAWGSQFGTAFTSDTAGCLHPPCATLNPPPPVSNLTGLSTDFHWQTAPVHFQPITPCESPSSYRSYEFIFKVTDDFCPAPSEMYKRITIVLKEPSAIPDNAGTISGPASACPLDDSLVYTLPPIPNAIQYHWTLPAGFSGNSTTNTIIVHAGLAAVSGNITVYGSNGLGDGVASTLAIVVGGCGSITGNLRYANTQLTPLGNVSIVLKQNGNWIAEAVTDNMGYFQFTDLPLGQYTIAPQCNKPWGGVNAADALSIMKHTVGLNYLTGIRALAADVDMSGQINSLDALFVAQRYVNILSWVPAGDWVYWNTSVQVTGTATYTIFPTALCAGDVNASYNP